MSQELQAVAPILLAVAAGIVSMIFDAIGWRRVAVAAAGLILAGAGVLSCIQAINLDLVVVEGVLLGGLTYAATQTVILACCTIAVFGGWNQFTTSRSGPGAVALIGFSAAASGALASSTDLFMTLIALETIAVCAYGLVASRKTAASAEASMKYLIQGAVATGLIVMGIAIIFGLHGAQSSYISLNQTVGGALLWPVTTAMALFIAAFAFKMGAFPFHSWAPDAFETAPPPASAFMAGAPKVAAVLATFLVFGTVFAAQDFTGPADIAWVTLATASIVFGNLGGLRQTSYGRMLAYSGIAQIGYALVGLSVRGNVVFQTMFLVSAYALAVAGAFIAAEAVRVVRPTWDGSIAGMAGLAREYPGFAVALGVVMFSLTGIPLTAGFWGKLLVFVAAVSTDKTWLVVVAVIGSVVSFGYYGGVLRSVFFDEAPDAEEQDESERDELTKSSRPSRWSLALVALGLMALGVAPLFVGLDFIQRFFGFA